jgi:MFS family permease
MIEQPLFCANHPNRETTLRCNRCGKPICASCAVHTPVGYRCRECLSGQQKVFENARQIDLPTAVVVAAVCVGLATAVLRYLDFWGLFVAPVAGGGIAEIVRWAVRRRRSRNLALFAVIGGVLGVLVILVFMFVPYFQILFLSAGFEMSMLGGLVRVFLWPVVSGVLVIGTLYARLRDIRL